jgi:aminotransferase in exopolysaccharide biosynthesis
MKKLIPLSVPNISGKELEYVSQAIKSGWVSTSGPLINQFESNLCSYVGSKGAVSCQNGTSGLHISLILCGVNSTNEVFVPTLTFIASVNPVKYVNAEPIFMDCDDSLGIDPAKLEKFCTYNCNYINHKLFNKKTNKHIKAIIVTHIFGNLANMEKIMDIAKRYSLFVIEDAAEALGTYYTDGKYKNKFAGTIGDIGVFSFNGNKIITTGGGGMIVSNNPEFLQKARHLTTQAKKDETYFIHDEIGYNYRMTNLQAALGIAQLELLEKFISIKTQNYDMYFELFNKKKDYTLLQFRKNSRPNYWFYSLLGKNKPINIKFIIDTLKTENIQVRPIWALIHQQKPYLNSQKFEINKAYFYVANIINLPCSTNLTPKDISFVYDKINKL